MCHAGQWLPGDILKSHVWTPQPFIPRATYRTCSKNWDSDLIASSVPLVGLKGALANHTGEVS